MTTATCTPICCDLLHLARDALEHGRIDAVVALPEQRFARELHQDALVAGCGHLAHALDFAIKKTPPRRGFRGRLQCLVGRRRRSSVCALTCAMTSADEVLLLLLDAGADLEALERRHAAPCAFFSSFSIGDVGVLHERLAGERDLVQRLAQPAFDHLRDDLGGLGLPSACARSARLDRARSFATMLRRHIAAT